MRTDPFVNQRRTVLSSECDVLSDHVLHSVSAESVTPGVREQELRWLSSQFFYPSTQHRHRWLCQRSAALLAPFSFTTDVSANTEEDILLSQTSYLGEPQASLDSGQKDRVIASTNPGFLVHRAQKGFDFRSSEVIDRAARALPRSPATWPFLFATV
jgi:hypothetical protein